MPKIEKTSHTYEHAEALIKALRLRDFAGKSEGNLTSAMTAAIAVKTLISELIDTASSQPVAGKETNPLANEAALQWLEALLEEGAKAERSRIRAVMAQFCTAAKNWQDSYAFPSGLLHKSKLDGGAAQAEFD